jgi:hypothetical protein
MNHIKNIKIVNVKYINVQYLDVEKGYYNGCMIDGMGIV